MTGSFLSRLTRRRPILNVLAATLDPDALAALGKLQAQVVRSEAFTTGGVYAQIAGQNLIVADLDRLPQTDGVSAAALRQALDGSGVAWCGSREFAAAPADWEQRALAAIGAISSLPPKAVAFVSFSGGVGKTSCALDLARYVATELKLPAAMVELTHGVSAVRILLGLSGSAPELPHLYQIVTQAAAPGVWQGVTVLPMEYEPARLLLGRVDEIVALLTRLKNEHILTVFDCEPDHEFWPHIAPLADEVYGLASPRPDAFANATQALQNLDGYLHGGHTPRTGLIVNQMRLADRVALAGAERLLDIPYIDNLRLNGALARRLLPLVYPGWRAA